jgi:hypothetical protein
MWLLKEILRKELPKHLSNKGAFPARGISGLIADASPHRVDDRMFEIDEPLCYKSELERQAVKRLPSFS